MKSLSPRRAVLATVLAVLVAVAVVPAIAYAIDGDIDTPMPLTVPSVASGTLNVASDASGSWGEYWYTVHLDKGQTLAATLSVDPSVAYPTLDAWESSIRTYQSAEFVANTRLLRLRLLAPKSSTYTLYLSADNIGPFSIDTTIVPAVYYTLANMTAPTAAQHKNKAFTVSTSVSPDYDGLTSPITFYVQQYLKKKWATYGKALTGVLASGGTVSRTPFKTSLKLPAGTFRVRARFMDAGHPSAKYTAWKTVKVK